MFYNLKIIFRSLRQNGIYTAINILGMTIALAAAILIFSWVRQEHSYDRFHKNAENIYIPSTHFEFGERYSLFEGLIPSLLAPIVRDEIPEIEGYCRIRRLSWGYDYLKNPENGISINNSSLTIGVADSSFFKIFSFDLISGDIATCLTEQSAIVLSESAANIFFGNTDPIGKQLIDNNGVSFYVAGIYKSPRNTSLNYDAIIPMLFDEKYMPGYFDSWGEFNHSTYFVLNKKADIETVEEKLADLVLRKRNQENDAVQKISLMPITKVNLYNADGTPNAKMRECRLYFLAALLILATACINFINIVTARASKRDKELQIRSILGVKSKRLFRQIFLESSLLFLISLLFALLLIGLILPFLEEREITMASFDIFSQHTWSVVLLVYLFVSIVGGIYPAYILSKGTFKEKLSSGKRRGRWIRRVLVIIQFSTAIILIIGSISTRRQMNYIRNSDMGFDMDNLIYVDMPLNVRSQTSTITSQLESLPQVLNHTYTWTPINNVLSIVSRDFSEITLTFRVVYSDQNIVSTFGFKLIAGRDFNGSEADDNEMSALINREALKLFGDADILNMTFDSMKRGGRIIGVIEDYHISDMRNRIEPMLIVSKPSSGRYLYIKTNGDDKPVIEELEKIWREYSPEFAMQYRYVKDDYYTTYKSEIRKGNLITILSVIAIFISCLGLLGLITYSTESRRKEIAIRKVLGADKRSIYLLLSKEYIYLLMISLIIAFPVAYIWASRIIGEYAYNTGVTWHIFALATLITVLISGTIIITIVSHILRSNPVDAIKTE